MSNRTSRSLPLALRKLAAVFVTSSAIPAIPALAADVSSTWLGGTGAWNDAAMWSPAVVPNNGSQTFDATLPAGSANLSLNVTLQKLNVTGAALLSPQATPFTVTANELFTWSGGRINNTHINANGSAVLNPGGVGSQFLITVPTGQTLTTNGGVIDMTRSTINSNGTMQVNASTRFTTTPNNNPSLAGTFINGGAMNMSAGLTLDNVAFYNAGLVNLNAGVLNIDGGGTWIAGRVASVNPASVSVDFGDGRFFLDAASDIPGNIALTVSGNGTATFAFPMTRTARTVVGNTQFFRGDALFDAPVTFNGELLVNSAVIANAGGEINGPFTLRGRLGGVTINAPATFTSGSVSGVSIGGGLNYPPQLTTNNSTISLQTSLGVSGGSTFTNNGHINATGFTQLAGDGLLNNVGSLTSPAGTTLSFAPETFVRNTGAIHAHGSFTQRGLLENHGSVIADGSLTLRGLLENHGSVIAASSGVAAFVPGVIRGFTGSTFTVGGGTGLVTNSARLAANAADNDAPSAGRFVLGARLTNTSQADLEVHIGGRAPGTEYDWFDIAGDAFINGELDVSFLGTFYNEVTAADTFTILTSGGTVGGQFQTHLPGGRIITSDLRGSFLVTYTSNSVILRDFSTEIPEPIGATGVAMIFALCARPRRRR